MFIPHPVDIEKVELKSRNRRAKFFYQLINRIKYVHFSFSLYSFSSV